MISSQLFRPPRERSRSKRIRTSTQLPLILLPAKVNFSSPFSRERDPSRSLEKGELKFTLAGSKIKGSWVLVRMRFDRERSRGGRNNWLLIMHHDDYDQEVPVISKDDRSV